LFGPTRGVVAIDRSAELSFRYSALHAIDGDPMTFWTSPPKDLEQWVVYELPTKTTITQVGASATGLASSASGVATVRFEGSLDGVEFRELATVAIPRKSEAMADSAPSGEVRYLRVTTLGNHGDPVVTRVATFHAKGKEVEPPPPPHFAGRWSVNDETLELSQDGSALFGVIRMDPPMLFYGAVQDRVARLSWSRGNETGIAWLAVNPSSTRLSGFWWWVDDENNPRFGETWYGEKRGEVAKLTTPISQIADVHIRKTGTFPLYGLVFRPEGDLDAEASRSAILFLQQALQTFPKYRVRLEPIACSSWDESRNLEESRERAAKLTSALTSAGLPMDRMLIEPRSIPGYPSAMYRLLYTRVDFSLSDR
jgi:hypothetical protein